MKTYSIFATLMLLAASAQADFNSGIISLDLYETVYSSNPPYGPDAAAIGNSEDIWNSVNTSVTQSAQGLKTTDGTTTTVGFTIGASGGGGGDEGGIYDLLFDYNTDFAIFTTGPNELNQITGLTPNFQYDLFLYSADNRSGVSVNGIGFSSSMDLGPFDSLVAGTDYSEHIVTADSSGNLNMTRVIGSTSQSGFSAFQLEAIPEPSTLALGTLAALIACRKFTVKCKS